MVDTQGAFGYRGALPEGGRGLAEGELSGLEAASTGVTGQTGTTLVERAAARLARTIVHHPWTVIAAACILTVLAAVHSYEKLTLDTDRNNLIGRDLDYNKRYIELEKEFGDIAAMTVVVEAPTRERCKKFAEDLAQRCAKDPSLYGSVFYRVPLDELGERMFLFANLDDLRELAGTLEDAKLPARLSAHEGLGGLFQGLAAHVEKKVEGGDTGGQGGGADMGAILYSVLDGARDAIATGKAYTTPWKDVVDDGWAWEKPGVAPNTRTSRYGPEGKRLCVLIQPVSHDGDMDGSEQSVHALRDLLASYKDPNGPWSDLKIGLTGGPVLAVDEMETSRRDLTLSLVVAFVAVILLFMISFRRVLGPLCAGICLAMAITFTFSFAAFTYGHLNLISIVFLEILIGLGIDFGIHLISRYDEERTYGMEPGPALEAALGLTGRASAAGATTTALAFMATLLADFQGIREFGVIAAAGILFCLVTMLVVLPAMVVIADRGRGGLSRRPRPGWARTRAAVALDRWAITRPVRLVLICLVLGALAFALAAKRLHYSGNLLDLQATNLESVQYANDLVQGDTIANLVADTPEQLEKYAEKMRKLSNVVDHTESLPVQQEEKLEEIRRIQSLVSSFTVASDPPPVLNAQGAVAELTRLRDGLAAFKQALENAQNQALSSGMSEAVDEIQKILDRLDAISNAADPERPDALGRARNLVAYETPLVAELSELMVTLREKTAHARAVTAADLPKVIKDRFVGKTGKLLVHIYPKMPIFDDKPLEEFVTAIRKETPELTGVPVQIYETGTRMKLGYERAGYFAFIFIAIYLVLHFRSLAHGGITLAALVVGAAIGTGLLTLKGETLNPANMLAIPLTLGIGVCYAIQLVHRHRQAYARRSVAGPQPVIATSTGRGVILSAGTNVVGFGALALAHHQGTASIGFAITFGVVGCLVAALFFLPALLRLWAGPSVPVELKGQPGPKVGPEGLVVRPVEVPASERS
jgi:hopanoid biosynthesis associated RND transporter like protein HpnN